MDEKLHFKTVSDPSVRAHSPKLKMDTLMKGIRSILATVLCSLALAGCQKAAIESDLGLEDAPDWVNQGAVAVEDEQGQLIQAVGMSERMGDRSLQRSTADSRARAEVARVLSTYVDYTLDDYASFKEGEVEAKVRRRVESRTQQVLHGVRIRARWRNPDNGDLYSFAEIDIKGFLQDMEKADRKGASWSEYLEQKEGSPFEAFTREHEQ